MRRDSSTIGVRRTYLKRETFEYGIVLRDVRARVLVGVECAALESVNVAFFCGGVSSGRPQKPG